MLPASRPAACLKGVHGRHSDIAEVCSRLLRSFRALAAAFAAVSAPCRLLRLLPRQQSLDECRLRAQQDEVALNFGATHPVNTLTPAPAVYMCQRCKPCRSIAGTTHGSVSECSLHADECARGTVHMVCKLRSSSAAAPAPGRSR